MQDDLARKITEYETRIPMLAQEIERINLVLRTKIEENSNLETRNRNLQQELDGHKKGIADYEFRFSQTTQELQTRITTYETKLKQATGEN